jgi:hypothetical protein
MASSKEQIDISPELRQRIKLATSHANISISEYVGNILEKAIPQESAILQLQGHPVTLEVIEQLRSLREQIFQENNGQFFEDSAELLRHQREERTRELDAVPHKISYSKEGKPLTREKLEHVLKVREEIIARTDGRIFDDSTEIIRQMRDERTRELDEL